MRRGLLVLLTAALLAAASSACAPERHSVRRPAATPSAATPSAAAPSTAAASPSPVSSAAGREGITGQTVVVNCPVDRGDPPCPGTPVRARLAVVNAAGRTVATVDTDGQGHFSVALPAGAYTLRPVLVAGAPARRPTGLAVTVGTGRYTTVTMRLDTGLR